MTQSTILKHPFAVLKCINQTPVVYNYASSPLLLHKKESFCTIKNVFFMA